MNLRRFTAVEEGSGTQYRVRRLSSPSYQAATPRGTPAHLLTIWLWYWRAHDGHWDQFGLEDVRVYVHVDLSSVCMPEVCVGVGVGGVGGGVSVCVCQCVCV